MTTKDPDVRAWQEAVAEDRAEEAAVATMNVARAKRAEARAIKAAEEAAARLNEPARVQEAASEDRGWFC